MRFCLGLVFFLSVGPTTAASAQGSSDVYQVEFQNAFDLTDTEYGIRISRLRTAGWITFGLATTVGFITLAHAAIVDTDSSFSNTIRYSVVGGLSSFFSLVGLTLVVTARIKVGRRARFRRRFRERQAALDRSYFHPELDIGITPGGLSLHLSF